MSKNYLIIIIISLSLVIVGISGCTSKTATNGTFGEKYVSIDSILISHNTTSNNFTENGTQFYYVEGYLENNNSYDAFHVKINGTVFDKNGNIVGTNDSADLEPVTIPAEGVSLFYIKFNDPNNSIVRYDVKVVDASGTA